VKKAKFVNPKSLPEPVGFNHGVLIEGKRILFLAGQNGAKPAIGDRQRRFHRAVRSGAEEPPRGLEGSGRQAGTARMMNIYVTDREEYGRARPLIGALWKQHLGRHYPACAMFEVKGLWDRRAKVELEGIAVL